MIALQPQQRELSKTELAVFVVWLFQLSAIIGISLGFEEWFVSKTPLNLGIITVLFYLVYPLESARNLLLVGFFFLAGMTAEWVGVHYDWLFGSYHYGDNLGWKFQGVPYLIGLNWMILVFITGGCVERFTENKTLRVIAGAGLMIFLDFFMEHAAHRFDFWHFAGDLAPLQNYVAWFGIAVVLHALYQYFRVKANLVFSYHLYAAQLVFFGYFFLYFA